MTKIYGPFHEHYRVSLDGHAVPLVELSWNSDDTLELVLDRRFGLTCNQEELQKWLPIVANAMAIGAGYSCHGENSVERNPYKTKVMEIGNEE